MTKKMKRMSILLLLLCTVLATLGGVGISAEDEYPNIGFYTFRTEKQLEKAHSDAEAEEMLQYIKEWAAKMVTYPNEELRIFMSYDETVEPLDRRTDFGISADECTVEYLKTLCATTPHLIGVAVSTNPLPLDDDFEESPASQTGDGAVYGVAVLGVAAVALTFLVLRKKKI